MERLWAPWRMAYVASGTKPGTDDPCFICRGLAESDDRGNLIALRTEHNVVLLNRFPYNNGHLLVAPRQHRGQLDELSAAEMLETMQTMSRMVKVLKELMSPDGFNIGLNLGRSAGAGLPGHLHWHIVPRWTGDTNFLPVFGGPRGIPSSLD